MLPLLLLVAASTACLCAGELFGARYRCLALERRGESFRDFTAHFRRASIHADVLLAVQEFIQLVTSVRGFPMRPSDQLLAVYGLQPEDVRDAVAVVAAGAHCLSPDVLEPAVCDGVTTIEDLVYAVHRVHRQAQAAASAPTRYMRMRVM